MIDNHYTGYILITFLGFFCSLLVFAIINRDKLINSNISKNIEEF